MLCILHLAALDSIDVYIANLLKVPYSFGRE